MIFLLLTLVSRYPMIGEPKITASEYVLNMYPNKCKGMFFFASSIGRKGAIKAYAQFDISVMNHILANLQSHLSFSG